MRLLNRLPGGEFRPAKPLPRSFFARPTATVARELVGMVLVRGRHRVRIVETEAYLGREDLASHARFGPTPRSSIMFGPPGKLYVYLVYGMHHCMNVVTERAGKGGAVLIRAAGSWNGDSRLLSGPGKLCKGLGIARRHNGLDVTATREGLFFSRAEAATPPLGVSPRIGVDYAGIWARKRLRFYWKGHPAVSKKKFSCRKLSRGNGPSPATGKDFGRKVSRKAPIDNPS